MKKANERKSLRLDPDLLQDLKPPLLILDGLWQEQFKNQKSGKMIALENKIKNLMIENARIKEAEQILIQKKREFLNRILQLTDDVHERNLQEAKDATSRLQKEVLDINLELEELENKSDNLPTQLEDASKDMLQETILAIYPRMRACQERAAALGPEIEQLREGLQKASEERLRCEEEVGRTYQLLHNLIGQEIVDTLDLQYGWDGE
ncbi:MAG: hypothetical protein LBT44_09315 [Clostridiales bacterium]|jgi:predicted  nucleic acid-binding Zn-ribbon protein|nr:hypothetical protein [Clostridiales bacterium]